MMISNLKTEGQTFVQYLTSPEVHEAQAKAHKSFRKSLRKFNRECRKAMGTGPLVVR